MTPLIDQIMSDRSGAIFGAGGTDSLFRYVLWRRWGDGKSFAHLNGLNPSTADALKNDPTIRREIGFCQSWGMDGLIKTNAFGFRATDPRDMKNAAEAIGEENDFWIYEASKISAFNVACWGVHGTHLNRNRDLRDKLQWKCFGLTKDGHPKHPLYLKSNTTLREYSP